MTTQTEIINLSDLIPSDHIYRQFTKIIDIDKIANKHLSTIVGNSNYKGYGINTLFKASNNVGKQNIRMKRQSKRFAIQTVIRIPNNKSGNV
ncbi:hypothetical protein SPONN_1162 [uncultured Candidatus Thioglobus sp.]|nr:hypothetical protein SPONN_1162 [uncultured Candidatus Thioglobus sp.]